MTPNHIIVYGTTWCGDTRRARQVFKDLGVDYEWVDIDQDQVAAELVKSMNNGYRSVPTILFPDGSVMVEPSGYQLRQKLESIKPN
jgi:mycoredoxin